MGLNTEVNKDNKLTEEFKKLLENDFKDRKLEENNIVSAVITEITKNYVVVDLKAKQEGMIPIEEFKNEMEKIKVGQKIEVFLDRIESYQGEIIVSRDKAKKLSTWKKMEKFYETQEELEGFITSKIKGGVICVVEGLPTFMPQSQIDVKPPKRIDHLMNVPIKVIATKIDRYRGNVCTSRRAVLEKGKNEKLKELLKNLKEGDIVDNAIVKATTDWGVFLDISGADALIHISDLSWSKVKKPSDIITIGQTVKVKIIKIDPETSRISASIKALTEDPYANLEAKYKVGKIYKGKITRTVDYGAFVKLEEGVEGLIHSSQIAWGKHSKANSVFNTGQTVDVKIMEIDKEGKKISLSYKETLDNPWTALKNKVGQTFEGSIEKITNIALLVKLENNLTGMVHFKELSYLENKDDLKKYSPKQKVKVKLLEVENEKIKLSIRALEKDPMDWFAEHNKKVGDVITTVVKEVMKTGVKVAIGNSDHLITIIKKNQLAKEASDQRPEIFQPGNKLDAAITELDISSRKITLSVKQAQIDEEKSLIKKFGKDASTSGAKLKDIFSKAFSLTGSKKDKDKEEK